VFTSGRYVIVDDDEKELRMLVDALQSAGVPCLGVRYTDEDGVEERFLSGARVLFLDLHLTTVAPASDIAVPAGIITTILDKAMREGVAPYIVVLWTKHSDQEKAFEDYLFENLEPGKRPLKVVGLDKNPFLAANTGTKLLDAVKEAISADPRLNVLLQWEREVLSAASRTAGSVVRMVPDLKRTEADFSADLDRVLSVLAREALGAIHAAADPRTALNSALTPILSDRLSNMDIGAAEAAVWKAGITRISEKGLGAQDDASKLNAMLHIALPQSEHMTSSGLGVVTLVPEDVEEAEAMIGEMFGLEAKSHLTNLFKIQGEADLKRSRMCLLRIGAACDFAQARKGPIPFVLGALMPAEIDRKNLPLAELATPPFALPNFERPMRMAWNVRMTATRTQAQVAEWIPVWRLREQLLSQVVMHGSGYATRPGIVSFS
jgi:hypothetical protein